MKVSEYTMSKTMYKELLTAKRKKHKKGSDQEYLCDFVNNEIKPLYPCMKVVAH